MKGNLEPMTITLNVRVFATSWAAAQVIQDIAEASGVALVRSFTEGNGDIIYKATGYGIADFRKALEAKGFRSSIG